MSIENQPTEQTSSTKRIAKNTLMLYFRQILIMLVSLYTVRVVLNTLGAEDYGIYNVVAGVVVLFGFLSSTMASASQRYFSYDLGKGDEEKLKKTFCLSLTIYFFIAVGVVFLAETVGLWFVYNKLFLPENRLTVAMWIYQFSVVSFVFSIMTSPFMTIIIAHENMNIYAYVSIIEVILKLTVAFLIQTFKTDRLFAYGLLMFGVTVINTTIYRTICKIKYAECKYKFYWNGKQAKEMFSYIGWNLFCAVAGICKIQIMNILLNQFFATLVNAARSIATSVNSAVTSFSSNFSTAINPQIVKQYASNEKDSMMRLVFRGCKCTYFLLLIFTLPLFLEMEFVLNLWLKTPPAYAIIFTRLTLLDPLMESMTLSLITAIEATGQIKLYKSVTGGILLLNLPISWLCLASGSPPESVIIVGICLTFIAACIRVFLCARLLHFSLWQYFSQVFLRCFSVTAISCVFSAGFFFIVAGKPIIKSLFVIFLSAVTVCFTALFVGFNANDRIVVITFMKECLHFGKRS